MEAPLLGAGRLTRRLGIVYCDARMCLFPGRFVGYERLVLLHGLTVFNQDLEYLAVHWSLDLVEELHCFNDADGIAGFHRITGFHKWWFAGAG